MSDNQRTREEDDKIWDEMFKNAGIPTKKENKKTLRVAWFVHLQSKPFYVEVDNVHEGVKILDTIADYDLFQVKEGIKPDHSNFGGLEMFEDGEWCSWMDNETGEDCPCVFISACR